jgi:hypothetical protein
MTKNFNYPAVFAAFIVGAHHGATGKPATPRVVTGTAAAVAAYVKGWNKGWLDAHTPKATP